MAKELLKGNVAAAEAACRAGMNFFAGYPITPSTEILEYLSHRLPELGRTFIQGENEIASINMVMGAAACGGRCLTASSGPGISLKASGYSYAAENCLPFVVINVQRWGCGLGSLLSGQSDYFRDVKGGGHGDFHHIVYAPTDIQELVDMTYNAFDIAEKYRCGVTILSEALLGQMMESVELPPFKEREVPLDWGIDGTGKVGLKLTPPPKRSGDYFARREPAYIEIEETLQQWDAVETADAEHVIVAFGLPSRVCRDAVKTLRAEGIKAGLIVPKTLYPYPFDAFKALPEGVKSFLSVETNHIGMMVEDVALASRKAKQFAPVYCMNYGPGIPRTTEVCAYVKNIIAGTVKERF
ncbi:MAG: 3-methyl-2-oxobutanoate dehydrogenase subunit beta [Firmicutes bacterium]|nr:3-methyl-2-oxobutanoate dehydrogenase subunit beta [Bacillota bacterium]